MHDAELELRPGMSGLGRPAKPGSRLLGLALAPIAGEQVLRDDQLRRHHASLGGGAITADRLLPPRRRGALGGAEMAKLQQGLSVAAIGRRAQQPLRLRRIVRDTVAAQVKTGKQRFSFAVAGPYRSLQPFR